MRKHYAISHPTRGWYLRSDYEWTKKGYVWVHRFAYSIIGTDKRVKRFYSRREVLEEMEKMKESVRNKCQIIEFGGFES
jgi:hypothetical protein